MGVGWLGLLGLLGSYLFEFFWFCIVDAGHFVGFGWVQVAWIFWFDMCWGVSYWFNWLMVGWGFQFSLDYVSVCSGYCLSSMVLSSFSLGQLVVVLFYMSFQSFITVVVSFAWFI